MSVKHTHSHEQAYARLHTSKAWHAEAEVESQEVVVSENGDVCVSFEFAKKSVRAIIFDCRPIGCLAVRPGAAHALMYEKSVA